MVDENLATRSATELAAGIRTKEWSSRELLDLYLDRIDRLNGPVNAVVTLDADRARDAADAADAALARGDDARSTARAPDHDQGRDRDRGHPVDRWRP